MWVWDIAAPSLDDQLNILGMRVWEHSCQLIGPRGDLPVHVPPVRLLKDVEELKAAASELLRLSDCQHLAECPGSDLGEVLSETKSFSAALEKAAARFAPAATEWPAPH